MADDVGKSYPVNDAIALMAKIKADGANDTNLAELATLLDEVNGFFGAFMSFMVHEIRKPMTSIRGYSDMLDKRLVGELNEMQGQFVGTIRTNVISMEKLVSDISDLMKIRTGRMRAEPKMDMAKNILLAIEKENKDFAAERNIELTFDVPSGLPILNLDSTRAIQALNKLVDNALKYTPEGGKVAVTANPTEGGLEIHIEDTGVGMSEEEMGHLGDLFFRGDDDMVTNTKGYGMGIPIVFECINLVGGKVAYTSEKGKGTKFTVFLPGMS